MRTIVYTERELQVHSHNNFFPRSKPTSYYSPDLFESVCAVRICPGEHILVSIEDHDILYTYNGQCCCGGCVSKTSNLMLTFEVINCHTKEIVTMPKKSSLTALLTHEYIKHKLCIASMNEICVNRYSSANDDDDVDDYNNTDVSVLGNWSTRYAAAAAAAAQQPPQSPPPPPRSFSCTPPSLPPSPPSPPPPPPPLATLNYQQSGHRPFHAGKSAFRNNDRSTATPVTWAEPLMSVHYIE
jgi:hypothetical protein